MIRAAQSVLTGGPSARMCPRAMIISYRLPLAAGLLVGLALFPSAPRLTAAPPAAAALAAGRVLVLDNDRTVEGTIERQGDDYRVRRELGETWIPAARVVKLCHDMDEAYAFLRSRANLNDPDEFLRLARWCHTQGMRERAVENVRQAVQLRPNHAESRRLLASLERAAAAPPPITSARADATPSEPPAEVGNETLGAFASKVQPILMNACARCHACGKGGNYKLSRVHDVTTLSRKSMQQNLAATLAQVNLQDPSVSPLLTKATTAHGDSTQAPLLGRQAIAFRTLEDWVQTTLATNPHLRREPPGAPAGSAAEAKPAAPLFPPLETPGKPAASKPAGTKPEAAPAESGSFATVRPEPPKPATAIDPFDPAIFNGLVAPPMSGGRHLPGGKPGKLP